MLRATRYKVLLEALRFHDDLRVHEMAHKLGVSTSTVRRDLNWLEREGLVSRVYGGAVAQKAVETTLEAPPAVRIEEHAAEKRRIGEAAAELVSDGETILVASGTTTEAMIPFLNGKERLTVLTNSINVALRAARYEAIRIVVLGGYLRRGEMSLLGHLALESLRQLTVDRAFFGAYAVGPEGVLGAEVAETETDRSLVAATPELIVLADSSKFARRGPSRLVKPAQIKVLITDTDAPADQVLSLEHQGVRIIQC
jgi:DeoR/GlpR family transcriptional regulator of sugar metabolism